MQYRNSLDWDIAGLGVHVHVCYCMSSTVMPVQVINLGNIAAKEPITHVFYDVTSYTPPSSRVLRFALAAIFYSLLAILMVSTVL